ncbi:MAG TPA: hypothetical protein VF666_15865 [Pyrinomonadaceae bacterium]
MIKERKTKTSYALSSDALLLIDELARFHGLSNASVIEMAIRTQARKDGVTPPAADREEKQSDDQR